MLGLSYGELFLILGATAALIGPKDLPRIAKTAGVMAGRAVGYFQMGRGYFENAMQNTQFRQVNKELRDTMAQLEAIQHEIRSTSILRPGPLTRTVMDGDGQTGEVDNSMVPNSSEVKIPDLSKVNHPLPPPPPQLQQHHTHQWQKLMPEAAANIPKDHRTTFSSTNLQSQATNFARLAESQALRTEAEKEDFGNQAGLLIVLPVSAESAGLLTSSKGEQTTGSDIVLEAVLEAEVARNAKDFFSRPENLQVLEGTMQEK